MDDVATELADIKTRNEAYIEQMCFTEWTVAHMPSGDLRRTVKALEAVLALHQPGPVAVLGHLCPGHENHRYFSITRAEAADVAACPDCTASVYDTCTGCGSKARLDQCPVRRAVAAALNPQEVSGG